MPFRDHHLGGRDITFRDGILLWVAEIITAVLSVGLAVAYGYLYKRGACGSCWAGFWGHRRGGWLLGPKAGDRFWAFRPYRYL